MRAILPPPAIRREALNRVPGVPDRQLDSLQRINAIYRRGNWLAKPRDPHLARPVALAPARPRCVERNAYVANQLLAATDPLGLVVCQGAPLRGEPIPDGPVQFNCPSQGFVGGYLMQTFTVSATPEAAPAPMWEMACGSACISGALGDAAAALQAAVNSFVDEMSYHPNSPGAGGGGDAGGGTITTGLTISGPANGDVPLNPRAQAIFSMVGQETGSLAGWKFWAGWEGGSLAGGAAEVFAPAGYDALGGLPGIVNLGYRVSTGVAMSAAGLPPPAGVPEIVGYWASWLLEP